MPKVRVKKNLEAKLTKPAKKNKAHAFATTFIGLAATLLGNNRDVSILGNGDLPPVKEWVPSGLPDFDRMLSRGHGLPVGRAIELFGNEQTGKTALCEYIAARYTERGGAVLWLNYEHALDEKHTTGYKVDNRSVPVVEPDHMEGGWKIVYAFLKKLEAEPLDGPSLIVWDSVAGSPTKAEIESDGDVGVAEQARIMSRHQRVFRKRIARSRCTMIFTNQIRTKIGVSYGDPTTRPCGKALDFMCDAMVKHSIIKTEAKGTGEDRTAQGYFIKSKATKSRLGVPQDSTVWYMSFKVGVDAATTALNLLKRNKNARGAGKSLTLKVPDEGKVKIKLAEWPAYYEENKEKLAPLVASKVKAKKGDEDDDEDAEVDDPSDDTSDAD